jgi:hypothetical protein
VLVHKAVQRGAAGAAVQPEDDGVAGLRGGRGGGGWGGGCRTGDGLAQLGWDPRQLAGLGGVGNGPTANAPLRMQGQMRDRSPDPSRRSQSSRRARECR